MSEVGKVQDVQRDSCIHYLPVTYPLISGSDDLKVRLTCIRPKSGSNIQSNQSRAVDRLEHLQRVDEVKISYQIFIDRRFHVIRI